MKHPVSTRLLPLLAASLLGLDTSASHAAGLNDTGIVLCGDASNNDLSCATDPPGYPRQDGRFGRAAMDAKGKLTKIGASSSLGFDYTKIANNGNVLAAGVALGSAAGEWACTRDNVTGLIWEVKTSSGLRSSAHTYTWYSDTAASNGGTPGTFGSDTCDGTLSAYSDQCNTQNYVAAVNALTDAARLCGQTDWRMPSRTELLSLLDQSKQGSGFPTIDASYFPNTQADWYWSGTNVASDPAGAWSVYFGNGYSRNNVKSNAFGVRLVRDGQ